MSWKFGKTHHAKKSWFHALWCRLILVASTVAVAASCGGGTSGSSTSQPPLPIAISITPSTASVSVNGTVRFSATVANTSYTVVNWSVQEPTGGSISNSGLYSAPTSTGIYHVIAVSEADRTKSATASITVTAPAPVFSSTPPTQAMEGTQYVYSVTASDPAGTGITYALTNAPAGASLSGNMLTWLPTRDQVRTANGFVVTASTAAGQAASQSWTVTPLGVVLGTQVTTFATETGDQQVADDMTKATVAALLPNGSSYTVLPGSGATDGTYTIPAVPAGNYWLQVGQSYFWTNSSFIDTGHSTVGRPNLVWPNSSTSIALQFSGMNPWQATDALQWYVANANAKHLYSSASLTGATTFSIFGTWPGYLLDAAQGDRAYVGQLVTQVIGGLQWQTLDNIAGPFAITSVDGTMTTVSSVLTGVAKSNTLRGNFKSSAFAQFRPAVNPAAVSDSTYALFGVLPGGSLRGLIGSPAFLITYLNTNGPLAADIDLGDVPYGNPFPANWAPILQYVHQFTIPYTAPGAINSTTATPQVSVSTTRFPTAGEPLQPLVGPITNPAINGVNFFENQTGVGNAPTLSWSAPSTGAATGYIITVYRLYSNAGNTAADAVARLWTNTCSVTLPANLLTAGSAYVFIIRAVYEPGVDFNTSPNRKAFPSGFADASSGMIIP